MFFSRENELKVFKLLGELGFGPTLLATLEDGRVEEFLEGKVSWVFLWCQCFRLREAAFGGQTHSRVWDRPGLTKKKMVYFGTVLTTLLP